MRTIIFIGSYKSGSSREAIRAAERLGFYTVLFTQSKTTLEQRKEYPDIHELILIDLEDLEAMRERIKYLQKQGKNIHAIVSFIDSFVYTAASLSEEFCGKSLSTEAIRKMEDKIMTRQTLLGTSYNVNYTVYEQEEDLSSVMSRSKLQYPVIVKSPASTGSKDVLKAKDEITLKKHVTKLQRKYPSAPILLEEYIEGPQYLVEALVYNNEVHIIAIIEQEISSIKNRFIVTGYSLLAKAPTLFYESISRETNTIIKKFGMENGSCHLELRYHNKQWKLIEINPRISGGAMNKMIEAAYGINLTEQILKVSLKEKPVLDKKCENCVFTQYLILSSEGKLQKVTGKKRALRHQGVIEVYVKPQKGKFLHPPWSMGHRYAYVMATGPTQESAIQIAKTAAKEIQFHLK
jgi:biotin carboxylase